MMSDDTRTHTARWTRFTWVGQCFTNEIAACSSCVIVFSAVNTLCRPIFLFCVFIFSLSFFHFLFIVYLVYDFIINI